MDLAIPSALIIMGGLGLLFGAGLAIASRVFFVQKDPRVEHIEEVLPGANCGACGAPGCVGFAEGVVEGKYDVSGCTVGGIDVAEQVAAIMGTEAGEVMPKLAVVRCQGDIEVAIDRANYDGIADCRAAVLIDNGAKGCVYGCLGMGTCVNACQFNAMYMNDKGLPVVIEDLCTGCGECVRVCPRDIMALLPEDQSVFIACVSQDFGKSVKSVCKTGCIGCSLCANPKNIDNEIITMDGKLPVIHYGKVEHPWDDLKRAVKKCPTNAFGVRGRILEEEEALEEQATA
ncbi:hypothetical protein BVY01_03895 [bacterium I07]|nr:hypothetical protein BVY01_03895 [bacterium I07]